MEEQEQARIPQCAFPPPFRLEERYDMEYNLRSLGLYDDIDPAPEPIRIARLTNAELQKAPSEIAITQTKSPCLVDLTAISCPYTRIKTVCVFKPQYHLALSIAEIRTMICNHLWEDPADSYHLCEALDTMFCIYRFFLARTRPDMVELHGRCNHLPSSWKNPMMWTPELPDSFQQTRKWFAPSYSHVLWWNEYHGSRLQLPTRLRETVAMRLFDKKHCVDCGRYLPMHADLLKLNMDKREHEFLERAGEKYSEFSTMQNKSLLKKLDWWGSRQVQSDGIVVSGYYIDYGGVRPDDNAGAMIAGYVPMKSRQVIKRNDLIATPNETTKADVLETKKIGICDMPARCFQCYTQKFPLMRAERVLKAVVEWLIVIQWISDALWCLNHADLIFGRRDLVSAFCERHPNNRIRARIAECFAKPDLSDASGQALAAAVDERENHAESIDFLRSMLDYGCIALQDEFKRPENLKHWAYLMRFTRIFPSSCYTPRPFSHRLSSYNTLTWSTVHALVEKYSISGVRSLLDILRLHYSMLHNDALTDFIYSSRMVKRCCNKIRASKQQCLEYLIMSVMPRRYFFESWTSENQAAWERGEIPPGPRPNKTDIPNGKLNAFGYMWPRDANDLTSSLCRLKNAEGTPLPVVPGNPFEASLTRVRQYDVRRVVDAIDSLGYHIMTGGKSAKENDFEGYLRTDTPRGHLYHHLPESHVILSKATTDDKGVSPVYDCCQELSRKHHDLARGVLGIEPPEALCPLPELDLTGVAVSSKKQKKLLKKKVKAGVAVKKRKPLPNPTNSELILLGKTFKKQRLSSTKQQQRK